LSTGGTQRDLFVFGIGTVLFLMAVIYRSLPIHIIPSWVPVLGILDAIVALLVMTIGLIIAAGAAYCYMLGSPTIELNMLKNVLRIIHLLKASFMNT